MTRQITQGVSCMVCEKQREPGEIRPRESRLIRGNTLLICTPCEAGGKEPRAYIILVARSRGVELVRDYIKHHRYAGAPITGKELLG